MQNRMSYDKLATIINKGFDQVADQLGIVDRRLSRIETGQENIALRLDNVTYRFELQELEGRVDALERKNA